MDATIHVKCPQSNPGRGKDLQENAFKDFKKFNDLVPKYGMPQIIWKEAENLLWQSLPEYVKAAKNLKCFMCTMSKIEWKIYEDIIDAGIDFIRIGAIGYNKENIKMMNIDNFDLIIKFD